MVKKNRKKQARKMKRIIKNFILCAITVVALSAMMLSIYLLAEQSMRALVVFILSVVWLVMFGEANSWGEGFV